MCFGDKIAGYAITAATAPAACIFEGEIYELYLRPEFQGLVSAAALFTSAKRDLRADGLKSMVIWALSDNEPAVEFYRTLGGRMVARLGAVRRQVADQGRIRLDGLICA